MYRAYENRTITKGCKCERIVMLYNMEERGYIMIDTNVESLAIKAEIKQKLVKEMGNNISEDDMKFLLKTFDDVSSRYRFSRKSR